MPEARRPGSGLVSVALPTPLRRTFDYLWPAERGTRPLPGCRVEVPFGPRRMVGVVMDHPPSTDVPANRLRKVAGCLDDEPLFSGPDLTLLQWAADYWRQPIGELVSAALPGPLRKPRADIGGRAPRQRAWRATPAGAQLDLMTLRRASRQQALLCELLEVGVAGCTEAHLRGHGTDIRAPLIALEKRGLVERFELDAWHREEPMHSTASPRTLNTEQEAAVVSVTAHSGFCAWLLDGVTGSGKTEVYLALARSCLAQGRQVLFIVPEIGLAPQMAQRIAEGLDATVALAHSGLADGERLAAWQAARSGVAGVLLGTRSAILTPLPRLGLIIVDEEHDPSYKQAEGVRYHARDLAVVRARLAGCAVVLGSATPSLESLHNVERGRYQGLRLSQRAGAARPPTVELLDVRRVPLENGLSRVLVDRLKATAAAGEQALVFINRRGYAPTLLCAACGVATGCPHCDARLVYHRSAARMHCHHCGTERGVPAACEDCGSPELRPSGVGTERVLDALARALPGVRLARIDRDTARRRGDLEAELAALRSGATQVAVGTQMLAKGHDLPRLTLVGVIDVDAALAGIDFRAPERLAQTLVQVAGRAGRAELPGQVIVQTHQPDHPVLQRLLREGYRAFAEATIDERDAAGLPPGSASACLRVDAEVAVRADAFAASIGECARALQQATQQARTPRGKRSPTRVLGPVPAPMERRAGRYRRQLWLFDSERQRLHRLIDALLDGVDALPRPSGVRWSVDVDPLDIF